MQLLLPKLNSAAAIWFSFVGHAAWQASLLAVLLLAVVALGRRWPSPLRYWLLVLALVKFALPPMLSMPTGLFSKLEIAVEPVPSTAELPALAPATFAMMDSPTLPDGISAMPEVSDSLAERTSAPTELHSSGPVFDFKVWLMLAHAAGALTVAFWILWNLLAMRRTLRRATEVPDGELRRRFVGLSKQFGRRHPPRLLFSREPYGPAALGVLRPVVVLPDAVASLDASALDAILAHELAHHRRRDPCINWLQLALTAVWWFNPLVWVLNRQIRKVREDCCDDLLLTRNLTTGPAYCDTLLTAASRLTQQGTVGVALGFGDGLHPLGRRLERIMDQTLRRAPRLSLWGILVLAISATVFLPGLRRSEGDESAPPVKQAEPASDKVAVEKAAGDKVASDKSAGDKPAADADNAAPAAPSGWPEGATIAGRVVDHRGAPVVNAEVLLLGAERVIVDAERRNWFALEQHNGSPASTRTDKNGAFTITRKQGKSDRLGVIADDPLFWVVSRKNLPQGDNVEIKLPAAGSLAVHCDLPGKPPKLPVIIESKTFDGVIWNTDWLRFHMSTFSLDNPGETVFEHLAPGQYSVQSQWETKTGPNSMLLTGADRQLVQIESAKRANVRFERKSGRPLSGQVRGLENVELRYAYVTIHCWGPEEVLGNEGKLNRMYVAFDVIPITSDGRFTTDPIPPGKYTADLFAVLASTPQLSSTSSDFAGNLSFTVPEEGELPRVELVAKANDPRDLSKVTDLRVRVVDEDGKAVAKAEAMVNTADQGCGPWAAGRDGLVFLGGAWQYRGAALQVLVRADGYASAIAHFAGTEREKLSTGEAAITLRQGQKVQLQFNVPEGMTWPTAALPEVYFDDMQQRVRMMRQPSNRRDGTLSDFNMLNLKPLGAGRFEFQLADDTPRFHVAVQVPGFLQFFETGPFTKADAKNGSLEVNLPRPATLDVSFEPGDHADAELFKSASLDVLRQSQGNSYLSVASAPGSSLTPRLKLTDLSPGQYLVDVRTQPQDDRKPVPGGEINVGAFFDRKMLTLKDGQTERIDFRSVPYDPNAFRGTRKAVIRISTPDGKPAKDRQASVTRFDGHYGSQTVFTGTVPESGEIVLTDVTDAKLPPSFSAFSPYQLSVDGQRLGSFGFAKEMGTEQFDFALAPGTGDMAPDVKLTNLATGEATSLTSFRGKVVFLEFWATWCGPCQEPMSKLNALDAEERDAWKDRVAIVPVSIDSEQARVMSHVREREWTGVQHYWSGGPEGADFESPAARAFVVSSVPHAFLIGPDGRIRWRGHPLDQTDGMDVKSRIERTLK